MLGYVTPQDALAAGCSHHARYMGLPCWIGDVDGEAPLLMAKVAWLDWALEPLAWIEGTLAAVFWPDEEPVFGILLGPPIETAYTSTRAKKSLWHQECVMHEHETLRAVRMIIAAAPRERQEMILRRAQELRNLVNANIDVGLAIALVGAEMAAEEPWFAEIANRR